MKSKADNIVDIQYSCVYWTTVVLSESYFVLTVSVLLLFTICEEAW